MTFLKVFPNFLTDSKFLITTGSSFTSGFKDKVELQDKSEIIDLSELGNYICPDWVDHPIRVYGATGGLLRSAPVVCGGGTEGD